MRTRTLAIGALVLLSLLVRVDPASACGMLTHREVGHRATLAFAAAVYPDYAERPVRHADALEAGSVFPDWGYAFGYPDESEAAHWAPFIEAAGRYIARTYPGPWDEETERLAVFLMGIASHSVADQSWHGLGYADEGFLDVMGDADFDGSFSEAHSVGDPGGDMVAGLELDLFYRSPTWYVPVDDMAAVYQALGFTRVTPGVLSTYTGLMFLGSRAEERFAGAFYGGYAGRSAFLVEQLEDYHVGGLDDMAIWTAWVWEDLIPWMEEGAGPPLPGAAGASRDSAARHAWLAQEGTAWLDGLSLAGLTLRITRTGRGVIFSVDEDVPVLRDQTPPSTPPSGTDRSLVIAGRTPHAYLGESLAAGDFNGDGAPDLAIGAPGEGGPGTPQTGAVHIVYGGRDVAGHEVLDLSRDAADRTLAGNDVYGRFGFALATVDLNADGADDLAVSSPTLGAQDLSYSGRVEVFFGDPGTGRLHDAPDLVVTGTAPEENLGWHLAAGDLDGDGSADLLVGSPFAPGGGFQRGSLLGFLAAPERAGTLTPEDADLALFGEADGDWFGYEAGVAKLPDGRRLLLVGAPRRDAPDWLLQGVGMLYAFDISDEGSSPTTDRPAFTITGTGEMDKLGSAFAVGDLYGTGEPMLVLSAPTRTESDLRQAGAVGIVPLAALSGARLFDHLPFRALLTGDAEFARLGWRVVVEDLTGDGKGDLVLTQPRRDTAAGTRSGRAFVFAGGAWMPWGRQTVAGAGGVWRPEWDAPLAMLGDALAVLDLNADGAPDLALGARRDSRSGRESGSVALAITPVPRPEILSPGVMRRGTRADLSLSGEGFDPRGLAVSFQQGEVRLVPTFATVETEERLRIVLDVPAGAPTGRYDLTVRTVLGSGTLAGALEVGDESEGPPDGDETAGESDNGGGCGR